LKGGKEVSVVGKVKEIVLDLLQSTNYKLYDVEQNGGILKVTIDSEKGITLDQLAEINRKISHELDQKDPIPNKYTLEVSSPGLERKLRTKEHFLGAENETITIKLGPHVEGARRIEGALKKVEEETLIVESGTGERHRIEIQDITNARTVFNWEKNPKPGTKNAKPKVLHETN
tara:strand:+ start:796 stop:1317 length:522 start_codon:yes stop_codon:yes gene_type:complete